MKISKVKKSKMAPCRSSDRLSASLIYSIQRPAFVPFSALLQFTWASFVFAFTHHAFRFSPHFLLPWFRKIGNEGQEGQ